MIEPIINIKGKALPLPGNDIDTDRIIPARFLRCVTFDGLGDNAFRDERFSPDGKPNNHPMNDKKYEGAVILLSGNNFGCGSSREHAPQAIKRAGYKAIIAESFAEIFYGNSSVIGLVCATLPKNDLEALIKKVQEEPDTELEINIKEKTLKAGCCSCYNITIKDSLQSALINGTYDPLAELMKSADKIAEMDKILPPLCYAKQ